MAVMESGQGTRQLYQTMTHEKLWGAKKKNSEWPGANQNGESMAVIESGQGTRQLYQTMTHERLWGTKKE